LAKGRRSFLTTNDAEAIAAKLGADVELKHANHAIAIVRVNGIEVGRFGIRRGMNLGHDYIPRQIHCNMRMALNLSRCTKYRGDYETALRNTPFFPIPPTITTTTTT
jgi:hypothetical protein